jgi:hypothetical protein
MRRAALALALVAAAVAGCSASGEDGYVADGCRRADLGGRSVARVWNEALLDAIRRDVPAPTVHARNLFHVAAGMWDAWAAYDPAADGYVVDEKQRADDARRAREAAMSYAAYRILLQRYSLAAGLEETFADLEGTMEALCYRPGYTSTEGDSPAALGNRIAAAVLARGRADGSLEAQRYANPDYRPVNDPLVVGAEGAPMRDPSRWQPLALERQIAQNGLPVPGRVQTFIGSHWGRVRGFALPAGRDGLPIDPGAPPRLDESPQAFRRAALEVIRYTAGLDARDGATLDVGPGARGGSSLGRNDGSGHARNPATGRPYAPNRVVRGDFARALAEFWADGPDSETPPGHWNAVANEASDAAGPALRIGGRGEAVDRLEWDVKLLFALNGALHDAAVAAWGVKAHYDSARPISMVRHLGANGQSTDPDGPAYHPEGLPLAPGLVEVVTRSSSRPGARHAALAGHVGEVAVKGWLGPERGVGWTRAVDWVPYQRPTFVTPAFAGYVSGHSTFSRAAGEVLTAFTGSEFFPGGLLAWPVRPGDLRNERGPSRPLTLQWATYFDAADDAGISRLYGGIHISADDLAGRRIGAACGRQAWALAARYFAGTARA